MQDETRSKAPLLTPRFLVLTSLVLMAALCRLVDHGYQNVAPVAAMALFGGACFASRRAAFLVPLSAMLVSDVLLNVGRYSGWQREKWLLMVSTYLAFALIVGIGFLLRGRHRRVLDILGASLAGSLAFFAITNLGFFLIYQTHEQSLIGLMQCYRDGIPFLRNTIAGDLLFNGVLFGAFALAESRVDSLRPAAV